MTSARQWLERIGALPLQQPVRVMNVCGGHERTIGMAGLRKALPPLVQLIAGPGCPVCVCPEEIIHDAIQLALHEPVTLMTFGDMLRVPVNVPRGQPRSLDQARAAGADIRPLASPLDALRIARADPKRACIFFAVGFETTTAPVAAMLAEGAPDNLSLLLAGRQTWPAVAMLMESDKPGFDALIAPGHVATIMGTEQWRFVVEDHGLPVAVGGFDAASLLAALYSVLRQTLEGQCFLDNCYPEVVRRQGNPTARACLSEVMTEVDAQWRGIGTIKGSGFSLREQYHQHDTYKRFSVPADPQRKRIGQMPPGCDCAGVVLGKLEPDQCRLFGRVCTPREPVGPCMVSDEGACRIWWSNGVRTPRRILPVPIDIGATLS